MRRSLAIIGYVLVLFLLPLFEVGVVDAFASRPWIIFFPLIAVLAYFFEPQRDWWVVTLAGAAWRDIFELLPYGTTILAAIVLGVCLTLLTGQLAQRSFWSDCIIIAATVLLSAASMSAVLFIGTYLGWRSANVPDIAGESIVIVCLAILGAIWLRREARRHQFVY